MVSDSLHPQRSEKRTFTGIGRAFFTWRRKATRQLFFGSFTIMIGRDDVSFHLFRALKSSITVSEEFDLSGPVSQDEECDIGNR